MNLEKVNLESNEPFTKVFLYESTYFIDSYRTTTERFYGVYNKKVRSFVSRDGEYVPLIELPKIYRCCGFSDIHVDEEIENLLQVHNSVDKIIQQEQ